MKLVSIAFVITRAMKPGSCPSAVTMKGLAASISSALASRNAARLAWASAAHFAAFAWAIAARLASAFSLAAFSFANFSAV